MTDNDRRQFQRISFDAPVEVAQGKNKGFTKVLDISLKGMLVKTPELPLDISRPVHIRILLSHDVEIAMTAEWANEHKGLMAFRWTQLDIESLIHLRRLLELNTGDQSLIEREISRLAGADEAGEA